MNLTIDSCDDNVCHMSLSGKITQSTVDSNQNQLTELLGQDQLNQTILMSLQNTNFIDSSGIDWLLETHRKIREAGGKLVLHSLPKDIQYVMVLMRLDTVFRLAKDKPSAQAAAE